MTRRGQGEGSIYRRKDGYWTATVDLGWVAGRRRRRSIYGKTRQEVARQLTAALQAREQGLLVPTSKLTLAQYLEQWLKSARAGLRPSSYVSYEMYIRRHIVPELGLVRLDKLRAEQVQALVDRKSADGLSPQTVIHIRGILRRALGRAVRFGLVSRNVAALTDPPRLERKEWKPYELDEARRFVAAIEGDRLEALYVVALTAGLRLGELLGLRWQDVDLDASELHVSHSLQRFAGQLRLVPPKTAKSRRSVSIPPMAVAALRKHRARQLEARLFLGSDWPNSDLVFTTESGKPLEPRNVNRSFHRLAKRSGLPEIRFHDLRHSFATLLLIQGASPRIVMEMLGHSQISLTMNTYTHVMPALQHQASEGLERLLRNTSGT